MCKRSFKTKIIPGILLKYAPVISGTIMAAGLAGCGITTGNATETGNTIISATSPVDNPPVDSQRNDHEDQDTRPQRADILPCLKDGYMIFGAYEQDGDLTNGPEPIEWEILNSDDHGTLLVSRYVLDVRPYNSERADVTWETCTLRAWLNDVFYNSAFTAAEKEHIQSVLLENPDNPLQTGIGGNPTTDRIFLLSVEDIIRYYSFEEWHDDELWGYCKDLIISPTEYAKHKNVWMETISQSWYDDYLAGAGLPTDLIGTEAAWWWLRSPGTENNHACHVLFLGAAGWNYSFNVEGSIYTGVRPALYIVSDP